MSGAIRAVALDISKGFGRVWHVGILHNLKSYGICGQICFLVSLFFSNRLFCSVVDGKSLQERPINAGVTQGIIRGPTVFLLYVNELPVDSVFSIAVF